MINLREISKVIGRPPANEPKALPRLKAACTMAAPSNNPPGAVFKIETCSGVESANSVPAIKQTSTIQAIVLCPKTATAIKSKDASNCTMAPTFPGVNLSQRRPEIKFAITMQIPIATKTAGTA